MNPSIVQLHKKALSSWVFADPRRWHLFCYLLMKADEKGYAEISIRDYCKQYDMEYSSVRRLLQKMEEEQICESIVNQKRTIIFLCNYERYNDSENKSESIMNQKRINNADSTENTERKKPSPHTPYKEEKDNVGTEVATLQQQQQQAAGAEFSSSLESKPSEVIPAVAAAAPATATAAYSAVPDSLPIPVGTLEERRQHFWADCCHCHARHPEWPAEAVKSFFLFWTQLTQDGLRFKFETEKVWGIGHRMKWYIVHGQWLDNAQAAKLERIRSGGGSRGRLAAVSDFERRRIKAQKDEAQAVYDRYFEAQDKKT